MRGITGDRLEAGWKVCLERLSFAEICALFPIVEEMNAKGFNNWGIDSDDFCDLTQWLSGVVGGKCNAIIEEVNRLEKKNKQIDEPVRAGVDLGKVKVRRNCDVGTVDEQLKRFSAFCMSRKCNDCPFASSTYGECGVRWSQMPYEGGEK